ncbi:acyl-CoA reductase [Paenibacillus endoradicis]|uniref:acyl-CoA reductase n=1 Tax=Paenibacillus endoradicis TaxID=2972487 RepID=UPI0021598CEB|nr:acyl-CoA reductase [Paenibacillus endoradicis]MCR8660529.1 acyl-CoA reductase [Paenibacillus endoradicis]
MRYYWPHHNGEEALQHLQHQRTLAAFNNDALSFIQELSKRFVKMRKFPEIVALGFWMRKAHMNQLQTSWEQEIIGSVVKARGTVFHLAPSNVDTIFIYSWILSLLAGNRNIIRISSKEQLQTNRLLTEILAVLAKPDHEEIAKRTIVLSYPHHNATTEKLSMLCHTRVVWGGDATVSAIRKLALAPMANELVFADRFSMSVINAEIVNTLDNEGLQQLAERFYNDSFWFDQMACSSPRLVIWTGTQHIVEQAQRLFWMQVAQVIQAKNYELAAATQVQKLATGLWLATEQETMKVDYQNMYSRIQLKELTANLRERHCGAGLFYETRLENLFHIADIIIDKDQTLSYFGYAKEQLIEMIDLFSNRGIDRVVPIGQALDFHAVWDGQSFLRSFTREVVII